MKKLLSLLLLVSSYAWSGTVTGQITTATSGPIINGTLTLTPTQAFVVTGTATVVSSAVACYTDASGNVVGEPNPLVAPVVTPNTGSGTLTAGTYFTRFAYQDASGTTFYSFETTTILTSTGSLIVTAPVKQPATATGYKVFISTSSSTETLQGTVTGTPGTWANYTQSVPLVAGSALPSTNTTACKPYFSDEGIPGFSYLVGLSNSSGSNVSGFPQKWRLFGGSAGTVNLSLGMPISDGVVVYPQPIISTPAFNATQSILGGLNLNGFPLLGISNLAASGNVSAVNGTFSGNVLVGGTLGVTGNVTETTGQNQYKAYSFNSVLWVDGIKYTTLASCYADIPSTGGVCMVPPNYTETLAASITCSKSYSGFIFTGPATINAGANQFIVTAGIRGCFVKSWVPFGSAVLIAGTGVEWNYTGTTNAFVVGGSGSDTTGFGLSDVAIFINNAGSAAVALDVIRNTFCEIKNVRIIGPGGAVTQQGIILDGTGNYTGCTVTEPVITGVFKGIQFTGAGVNAGNANKIIGGQIGSPANGTSLGLDFQAGSSGNTVLGTDVENHAVGYNFGGTSQGNILLVRSESNTSGVTFGASTLGNKVDLINSIDPYTLAGTNNVVNNLTSRTSTGSMVFAQACSGTASAGTTLAIQWFGGACTSAAQNALVPVTNPGTLSNFRVKCGSAGTNASSGLFTLRVNGSPSTLTCTVGTGTSCSDTTHAVAVVAGDRMQTIFTTQAAETLADCAASWEKQ
jgi:hypothetical protein